MLGATLRLSVGKYTFPLLAAVLLGLALNTGVQAQTALRIAETISQTDLTVLKNTTHPLARPEFDRGRVGGSVPMKRILLVLKPSAEQQTKLQSLIDSQHDVKSPNYHKWLTPEEYGAQFGPAPEDIKKITGWLAQNGFSIGHVGRGGQWIEFSGTSAQVENVFNTEMHQYQVDGKQYVANSRDISMPQALTAVVHGVLSLNNFQIHAAHTGPVEVHRVNGKLEPVPNPQLTTPRPDGTASHLLTPGDFHTIYNIDPLLKSGTDGTGVSIAIVARSNIALSDVETFRQIFGLPANDPHIIVNGDDPGIIPQEDIEADLDVQWSGAVAPQATIDLVVSETTFTTDGVELSAAYIVDKRLAPIMSTSFSLCEQALGPQGNAFFNGLWEQAVAEGITPLVSTGDNGAAGCDLTRSGGPAQFGLAVNGLASTPFNIAVGGTQFAENGLDGNYWRASNNPDGSSAIGYIPEMVWNESCDPTIDPTQCNGTSQFFAIAGSGGVSACINSTKNGGQTTCLNGYSKPVWQVGPGVPNDSSRDIPDVSLTAAGHDGYLICAEGSCQTGKDDQGNTVLNTAIIVAGTSASAPSMAGILSLVEQKNGAFQGLANREIYRLAAASDPAACNSSNLLDPTQSSNCIFYDTTAGNNGVPGQLGFNAVAGYDVATGWGSVNAANFVTHWSVTTSQDSVTTLAADTTTLKHGQPVNLNLAVKPASGSGIPSGDVSFLTDQFGPVGFKTLSNGSFSGPVTSLPGGKYSLTAHYAGDGTFAPSDSSSIPLNVTTEDSAVTVKVHCFYPDFFCDSKLPGPLLYGTEVFLDVTVAGISGAGNATGTVTVLDGSTVLGTVRLNNTGNAALVLSNLTGAVLDLGIHNIFVQYSGDNSFNSSATSQPSTIQIIQGPPAVVQIFSDLNPVSQGTPVLLTLNVLQKSPNSALPTGTAQFFDNGVPVGPTLPVQPNGLAGPVSQASFSANLPVGIHDIRASYSGDVRYLPLDVVSHLISGIIVTVTAPVGASSVTKMSQSASTINVGQSVNYVISVSPARAGSPVPTGTVSLNGFFGPIPQHDPSQLLVQPLVNGSATFSFVWSSTGPIGVRAQYSGDNNYSSSASDILQITVNPVKATVNVNSSTPAVLPDHPATLSVTVLASKNQNLDLPTGGVQFFDAVDNGTPQPLGPVQPLTRGNGKFVIDTFATVLPIGSNVITAQYLGNVSGGGQWDASTSANSVTVLVTNPDFSDSVTPASLLIPAAGIGSATITLAPIVGFTGSVTLTCAGPLPAGTTCTFSPSTVVLNGNPVTATLTLNTNSVALAAAQKQSGRGIGLLGLSGSSGLLAILLFGLPKGPRRTRAVYLFMFVGLLGGLMTWGCGSSGTGTGTGSGSGAVPSAISVQASSAKVPSGMAVTFTAAVSSSKMPTGTVSFFDGATALGTSVPVSAGQAMLQVNSLAVGTHAITAQYSGDANNTKSVSPSIVEAITGNTAVQVVASSGTLSHTVTIPVTLQ